MPRSYRRPTGRPAAGGRGSGDRMPGARWARRRGRLVVAALGPVAGVAAGGLTNLLTTAWRRWWFGGLALVTGLVTASTLIGPPRGGPHPARPLTGHGGPSPGPSLPPPSGTRVFVGRREELRFRLIAPDTGGDRAGPLLLLITGMPGAGKTELAIRAARSLAGRYPDGLYWVNLRTYAVAESRMTTSEVLRTLLNALGVPSDPHAIDPAMLARSWHTATAGKRLLVVLDDADTAEQLRPLLPAAETSAAMVTTRHLLTGVDPDRRVTVRPFSQGEAGRLAGAILRRAGLSDPDAVAAIASAFRLPLAIRQMSDLKAANPAQEIPAAAAGETPDEATAAFASSLAALPKHAGLVLRRVAHHPGSLITPSIAAVLAGRSADQGTALLATLYQRGLLIPGGSPGGGYRMHDAVRAAALAESRKHDSAKRLAAADARLFHHIETAMDTAVSLLDPSGLVTEITCGTTCRDVPLPRHESDVTALAWFDQHHADLLAVTRRCISVRSRRSWRLVFKLGLYQRIRGFYGEITELHGRALDLAELRSDRLGQAAMHQNLGLVAMRTGEYVQARDRFETSLRLYGQVGSQAGLSEIHHELSNANKWLGNLTAARAHAMACFDRASSDGNSVDLAFAHSTLGIIDRLEGRHGPAHGHLTRSLSLFEQTGHRRGMGICHRHLGILNERTGRYEDARTHLTHALFLFEELGDVMNEADAHHDLAVLYRRSGVPHRRGPSRRHRAAPQPPDRSSAGAGRRAHRTRPARRRRPGSSDGPCAPAPGSCPLPAAPAAYGGGKDRQAHAGVTEPAHGSRGSGAGQGRDRSAGGQRGACGRGAGLEPGRRPVLSSGTYLSMARGGEPPNPSCRGSAGREREGRGRPVGLAGAEHGGGEVGLVRRVGEVLGLQREPVALPVRPPAGAVQRAVEEVARVELDARLGRCRCSAPGRCPAR